MRYVIFIIALLCATTISAQAQNMDETLITDLENQEEQQISQSAEHQQEEQIMDVPFSAAFMTELRKCTQSYEIIDNKKIEILGMKNNLCHMKYGSFDIKLPSALTGSIRGLADLQVLLKNKDISTYNYTPDYIYDGLLYAIDACSQKKEYYGDEQQFADGDIIISLGLSANFSNETCTITLFNQTDFDNNQTDYSVICKIPYRTVLYLQEFISDLAKKYGERRGFGTNGKIMVTRAEQNKETHEADIALMYYMQQNGYCQKSAN